MVVPHPIADHHDDVFGVGHGFLFLGEKKSGQKYKG
jgi:hypothetical protein